MELHISAPTKNHGIRLAEYSSEKDRCIWKLSLVIHSNSLFPAQSWSCFPALPQVSTVVHSHWTEKPISRDRYRVTWLKEKVFFFFLLLTNGSGLFFLLTDLKQLVLVCASVPLQKPPLYVDSNTFPKIFLSPTTCDKSFIMRRHFFFNSVVVILFNSVDESRSGVNLSLSLLAKPWCRIYLNIKK